MPYPQTMPSQEAGPTSGIRSGLRRSAGIVDTAGAEADSMHAHLRI
ncbi:hypothetical protein [Mycobacterium attenuatum]|nr:hypothetical protein [Mycobacterium attenuatum]